MTQGIAELFMDKIVTPVLLTMLLVAYWVRNLFQKKGL